MFQSPHRAYGHSDLYKVLPYTLKSIVSISSSSLRSFRRTRDTIEAMKSGKFQSPHRAYGHSDIASPDTSTINV